MMHTMHQVYVGSYAWHIVGAGTEGPARGRGWWGARLAVSSVLVGRLTKLDETADGREVSRSLTATAGRPPPLTGGLSYQTYDTTVPIQRHQPPIMPRCAIPVQHVPKSDNKYTRTLYDRRREKRSVRLGFWGMEQGPSVRQGGGLQKIFSELVYR